MNKRSFIKSLLMAGVACAVLPGATTYARSWKAIEISPEKEIWIPNPEWVNANYEISFIGYNPIVIRRTPDSGFGILRFQFNPSTKEIDRVPEYIQQP